MVDSTIMLMGDFNYKLMDKTGVWKAVKSHGVVNHYKDMKNAMTQWIEITRLRGDDTSSRLDL